MKDNRIGIQRFVNKHRNEIMLEHFEACRLLGWTDQHEDDYYYILLYRTPGKGNHIVLLSCCGRPEPFKISSKRRKHLEEIWDMNGCSVGEGREMAIRNGSIIK